MSGLPYVSLPSLTLELPLLGSHTITVFGPIAALGIVLGWRASLRLAGRRGLPRRETESLLTVVALSGFAGAHWVSMLGYYPERVWADPWVLLAFTSGLSSVGGFIGGTLGLVWWTRRRRLPLHDTTDIVAYGLLLGFTVGRLGCALVHDHPGAVTDPGHPLAVGPWPDGQWRFDLGLVELLLLAGLTAWVHRPRALQGDDAWVVRGRPAVWIALAYAILRFPLDFLRAADPRYGPLTVAQYACLLFAAAALLALRRRRPPATHSPTAPDVVCRDGVDPGTGRDRLAPGDAGSPGKRPGE